MDEQNRNLILATVLSLGVILLWYVLFPPPEAPVDPAGDLAVETEDGGVALPPAAVSEQDLPEAGAVAPEAGTEAPRLTVETPSLEGSISLLGGRLDDLRLRDYTAELDPGSEIVTLFSPVGSADPYYALYGWRPGGGMGFDAVPGSNTVWEVETGDVLTPDRDVVLRWENGAGLVFRRTISVDEEYMFTVTQSVENTTEADATLAPYGIVARHGEPEDLQNFFILHEGAIRWGDDGLTELSYDNMRDLDPGASEQGRIEIEEVAEDGWVGLTDKYWMAVLVPGAGQPFQSATRYVPGADIFQTEARLPAMVAAPGETVEVTTNLFAGAKEWDAIRAYERDLQVENFVDSIDWGWFYFLTKPIFWLLHELNILIGNMGLAIIALTLTLKTVLLPLAYRSYSSMAKMRELQPQLEKIKERAGEDRQKLQTEMMELYKREKVNPAAGCLPILLQIPIFFSLYKVIFVTIELRHAHFFGAFRDLSAPDPTSIYNLFGLLPYAAPEPGSIMALVFVGVLPLILGISMWMQQKLNPQPTDPTQAMIFAWLPWVFMFMLGSFASGLLVYWISNNVLTFTQQYAIMRSHGYKPDLFGNIAASFRRRRTDEK